MSLFLPLAASLPHLPLQWVVELSLAAAAPSAAGNNTGGEGVRRRSGEREEREW